jgi:hypothetical protein
VPSFLCVKPIPNPGLEKQLRGGGICAGKYLAVLLILPLFAVTDSYAQAVDPLDERFVARLVEVISAEESTSTAALDELSASWQMSYVAPLLETISLTRNRRRVIQIFELLRTNTGQSFDFDIQLWYGWLWHQQYEMAPEYAAFKASLFATIDPRFRAYFSADRNASVRLDEVRWGGVLQDGIPPLRSPTMIAAAEAHYLDDGNIVFGIEIEGDARAYPKRILAWHEMFVDNFAQIPVIGVYCTLCGSMIIYETQVGGINYQMGTSGFLYRSNKLMYDRGTQSLWNTLWGKPVIGPLVGKNIQLKRRSVVTTNWGEWRRRHPDTTVLSLDTGYQRDYGEGVAYRDYFASDALMFNVPDLDRRLKNKDEVLAIILPEYPDQPLAIASAYLSDHQLLNDEIGAMRFVVVTDNSDASRVFAANFTQFVDFDGEHTLADDQGQLWQLSESRLVGERGQELLRLPAHRAFWFGWYSAYSKTRLIH